MKMHYSASRKPDVESIADWWSSTAATVKSSPPPTPQFLDNDQVADILVPVSLSCLMWDSSNGQLWLRTFRWSGWAFLRIVLWSEVLLSQCSFPFSLLRCQTTTVVWKLSGLHLLLFPFPFTDLFPNKSLVCLLPFLHLFLGGLEHSLHFKHVTNVNSFNPHNNSIR